MLLSHTIPGDRTPGERLDVYTLFNWFEKSGRRCGEQSRDYSGTARRCKWRFRGRLCLGCGWLHSADENPWTDIAAAQGRTIDRTPPPWTRPSTTIDIPLEEQADFGLSLIHISEPTRPY